MPILEILDFHYPKTLDSGKAQFSFISVSQAVLAVAFVVVVVRTRIFLATSRMALFAKLKIAFQVASRRPMTKKKKNQKKIKNSKSKKK